MYSAYRITFDSAGFWKVFLVLGKDPTFGINESSGSAEKNVGINFSKVKTQFFLILHIMLIIVSCLLMEKKSLSLKPTIKMLAFFLSRKHV